MPHVIVKLWPGKTDDQKNKLAGKITQAVVETMNITEDVISVGIEDIPQERWEEEVRKPEIIAKQNTIYKHSKSSKIT
jgi:4-oxalocrotonate tautomerase